MSDGAWMGADPGEAEYAEAQHRQAMAEQEAQAMAEQEAGYAEYLASEHDPAEPATAGEDTP